MYTKSACATNFGPLGEIGAIFPPQLSSQTQFAKIINKKLSPEINVKNIKVEFRRRWPVSNSICVC